MSLHYIICPVQTNDLDTLRTQGRQWLPVPDAPEIKAVVPISEVSEGKTVKN